ncbi:hypothetical protein [Methylobacterium sp.]|uniref:hypothetical protein n=1 Tax=Methylobacterium sp. TaxID=409 RepID=UPI003C76D2DC
MSYAPRLQDDATLHHRTENIVLGGVRLGNLYARYEEIDRQQRARANQAALMEGVLGVGTHFVGGQLLGAAGNSVQGMQAAAAATGCSSAALGQVLTGESSASRLRDVNDASLLA